VGLGVWVWGLGYWVWGPNPNPQSPIPNPQSPIFFIYIFFILKILIKSKEIKK
jgi:hypothetical protein